MSATPPDLTAAKKNLAEVLGEEMKSYLHQLKLWFRMKIAKEEFDSEARKLLTADTVHLHNEFLLAIFSKCHTLSAAVVPKSPPPVSSSGKLQLKKSKLKRRPASVRSSFQQRFVPVNPMSCAVHATYKGYEDSVFVGRELYLPDMSMLQGRMLVCAWEVGLSHVEDAVAHLVVQALEVQLKNIISQVLSRRNGYKTREGRFKYDMGTQVPNPYTRHSQMLEDRTLQSEATMVSSTGQHVPQKRLAEDCNEGYRAQQLSTGIVDHEPRTPVTLYTLLETLQTYKNTIPSHCVYAPAIERIIHRLWHPSHQELGHFESQPDTDTQKPSSATLPVR